MKIEYEEIFKKFNLNSNEYQNIDFQDEESNNQKLEL